MSNWILIPVFVTATVAFAQAPEGVSVLVNSVSVQQTPINRNGLAAQAELKVFRLRLTTPEQTFDRDVIIVREPDTGLYAWTMLDVSDLGIAEVPDDFRRWFRIASSDQQIAVFTIAGAELRVTASSDRQPSMQACQDLVTGVLTENVEMLLGPGAPGERVVFLGDAMDISLFVPAEGGALTEMPEINGAMRTALGWTVSLKGLNRAAGTINLSGNWEIVSATPGPVRAITTELELQ